MITWLLLILATGSAYTARFFLAETLRRRRQWPEGRTVALLLWFLGFAQDLAIGCWITFFLILIAQLPGGVMVDGLLLGLLVLYHTADSLLFAQMGIRIRLAYLRYLKEIRSFSSSVNEAGGTPSLVMGLVAMGAGLTLGLWMELTQTAPALPWPLLGIGTLALFIGAWQQYPALLKWAPDFHNTWFHELWQLLRRFPLASKREGFESLYPRAERYEHLHPRYPLLKRTHGFTGPTSFSLKLEKGERPHIVLLSLESFRAKDIGCFGAPYGATPCFDAMSDQGILFTQFHACGIPTARSVLATLYGVHSPLGPMVQEQDPEFPLIGLPHLLKGQGYHCAYLQGGNVSFQNQDTFFLANGFDEALGDDAIQRRYPNAQGTSWGYYDEYLLGLAYEQLRSHDEKGHPLFQAIYTGTHHHPWQPPSDYQAPPFEQVSGEHQRALATLHYTDCQLGTFWRRLKDSGLSRNTLLIVTADTGQPFGEHGHNFALFQQLFQEHQHIPLLLLADGRWEAPQRLTTLGSQVDLLPTLMDLLKIQGINHSVGTSLTREVTERFTLCVNPQVRPFASYRVGPWKYMTALDTREESLFQLAKDPLEEDNLLEFFPEQAEFLRNRLGEHCCALFTLFREKRLAPHPRTSLIVGKEPHFTDEKLANALTGTQSLTVLDLSNCDQLSPLALQNLAPHCGSLEILSLNGTSADSGTLSAFQSHCSRLRTLGLSGCARLSPESVQTLICHCSSLQDLNLADSPQVGYESPLLETLAKTCPKLRSLNLAGNPFFPGDGFHWLSEGCLGLRSLDLRGLFNVNDQTLDQLDLPQLRSCHLSGCGPLTDSSLAPFFQRHPHLLQLSLSAENLSGSLLGQLPPSLTKLSLQDCQALDQEALRLLTKRCPQLEELELENCSQLDAQGLLLLSRLPLGKLLISGTPHLTDASLAPLHRLPIRYLLFFQCPQLTTEGIRRLTGELKKRQSLRLVRLDNLALNP